MAARDVVSPKAHCNCRCYSRREVSRSHRADPKGTLRREILAGRRVPAAIPSKVSPPASISRRRARFRGRRGTRRLLRLSHRAFRPQPEPPPIARMRIAPGRRCGGLSPEGAFPRPRRAEPPLRRHFGAGGWVPAGIASKARPPARKTRRKMNHGFSSRASHPGDCLSRPPREIPRPQPSSDALEGAYAFGRQNGPHTSCIVAPPRKPVRLLSALG